MDGLKEGMQSKITKKHLMTPMHAFVVKYDLQIKTQLGDDPVKVAWMAIVLWFTKVREITRHAIIYPWLEKDQKAKEKVMSKQMIFPISLPT